MSDILGYEIFLPCRVFGVQVEFDDFRGLSSIEELFLRALRAGTNDIQALNQIFQLGERPLLDLIYDLWRRSYVSIDMAGARVLLAPEIAAKLDAPDELRRLRGGQHTQRVVRLGQDGVSGAIFPLRGSRRFPGGYAQTVPAILNNLELSTVRPEEIVAAVEAAVTDPKLALGERRVVRAYLSKGEVSDWGAMRWLPLRIDCARDPDADRLRFSILDTGLLDGHGRWRLEEELGRMSDRMATSYFFKQLAEKARPSEEAREVRVVLAELDERLRDDSETDRGLVGQAHDQLLDLAREASAAWSELEERSARIETLIGHAVLEQRIRELLQTAKHQLVLACPFVKFEPLNGNYWDALVAALERGVHVYLLWGIASGRPLDERVQNAFNLLAHDHPRNLHIAHRSTRTHAKFVIRDEDDALVSSFNFLDPSEPGTLEIGVSVRAPRGRESPGFVHRLLKWSREAFPDYVVGQGIRWGIAESSAEQRALRPPARPAVLPSGGEEIEVGVERASIQVWRRAWREYGVRLTTAAERITETAHLIIDGDHQALLWQALRSASRRLVIGSDRLTTDVVKPRFINALRARLDHGVAILALYRRDDERVPEGQERPDAALRVLQAQYPDRFVLLQANSHAKILLWDEHAVVSSFNFLSFEGAYGAGPALQRRRERSEIGVEIEGTAVEELAAVLRAELGDHAALATLTPKARLSAAPPPPARATALQSVLAKLTAPPSEDEGAPRPQPQPFEILRSWFMEEAPDPWANLDELHEILGRCDLVRRAAAACFAARPLGERPEYERRWRGRLAQWAWDERRFYESALLLGSIPATDFAPPRWLAELAAVPSSAGVFREHLMGLLESPPEGDAADAAAAVLISALLLHGNDEAGEVLEAMEGALSAPFRALAEAARVWWGATHVPVPIDDLSTHVALRTQASSQEERARRVVEEINQAAAMRFRFDSGTFTWKHLFHDNGVMGCLRRFAERCDVAAARGWREQRIARYRDLDTLLDESTRESGPFDLIAHKKRPPCLDALRRVIGTADEWIDQASPGGSAPHLSNPEAVRRLAQAVAAFGACTDAQSDTLAAPLSRVLLESTRFLEKLR